MPIMKLTPEQEAMLPQFREDWRKVGLSTEPIHADAAREAVRSLYRASNAKEPTLIIVLASPMACLVARTILNLLLKRELSANQHQVLEKKLRDQLGDQLWGQLGDQLWDQLWDQLRDQLRGQLGDQLGDQLRDQLWDQLGDQLGAQLGAQLWGQLGDQLGDQLWDQLGAQLRDQLRDQLWGQLRDTWQDTHFIGGMDAFWLAFYEFAQKIGARYEARTNTHFEAYKAYALSSGWIYAYNEIAFISDRPEKVQFDEQRRLHSETEMAVRYRDGWGVYAWHGTRIPGQWIADKTSLSAKTALTWTNIEQRRAALEIVGWHNVLRELKAKVIDEHPDPLCGALVEVQLPDLDRKSRFIHARCGTNREFAIGVPPECKTVMQAQAWLTGLPEDEFAFPTIRT